MFKIIHITDLHFGTEREGSINLLLNAIHSIQPNIIVISGDFTQRAKEQQFLMAQQFIQALPCKAICVPGNHDISLYNVVKRFLYPFTAYKKWINPMLYVQYQEGEIAILGINSVTPYKPMSGYVTDEQLKLVKDFFSQYNKKIKIIVMHHNLIRSERHKIINDSEKIINVFAECGINLVLSGHIHATHIEKLRNNKQGQPMYVITAGTATSMRTIEPNSFNVIDITENQFSIIVKSLLHHEFVTTRKEMYPL